MKELVSLLTKSVAKFPECVEVTEKDMQDNILFELKVNEKDRGRIIGKQGRTIKAIRHLLNTCAFVKKKKVSLEIVE